MAKRQAWGFGLGVAVTLLMGRLAIGAAEATPAAAVPDAVSYARQVRPIFRANCQGCHQPAKAGGGYVMTAFDRLLAGGDSKDQAVVPGKPEEGQLLEQITPAADGHAEMPKDHPPLNPAEIDLVRRWVAQGALNDAPDVEGRKYDSEHPPTYALPPVIAAMDFSPDGQLLAVGGFHEVLLWKADGSALVGRLIGLSERIESVRFSPDGKKLAVTGGLPGRMGEVQVWDVEKRALALSVPTVCDTTYGACWSPDGSLIAFGGTDNAVRAIDAKTGKAVLFMGSHSDWSLDTAFSLDGTNLISVGRDMTAKLTEVATQRFIDNITSITPGALKGGLTAVVRHPKRDQILLGGSDGIPKLYRIFRETTRVIGDDANQVATFTPMPGRVFSIATSADGHHFAAGSSEDRRGQVDVYSDDFDPATAPDPIKAILAVAGPARSPEQREALNVYQQSQIKRLGSLPVPQSGVYVVAVSPAGESVAAAGTDGIIRLLNGSNGALVKEFRPTPTDGSNAPERTPPAASTVASVSTPEPTPSDADALPAGLVIDALEVRPAAVALNGPFAYTQLVITAATADGLRLDVSRLVESAGATGVARVSRGGMIRPIADGQATLKVTLAGKSAEVPVLVAGVHSAPRADYVRDVAPVLSRLGCNQGTCHGSAQGKNGFKLSLRGYDPLFDVRALADDQASRRVNPASPDDSLMLLKPSGAVPHAGGQLTRPGEAYYETLRAWIAGGGVLDTTVPKIAKIEVFPPSPVIESIGARQQLRVMATYTDGEIRDVTREAFLESGNTEVATADRTGLMTSLRRGEAPILARFEGAYAAATLTVMGDRTGFVWQDPPTYNRIDELVAQKWRRMKIQPSELCNDAEFLRRVTLDLTGLPPTAEAVRAFAADPAESRAKREALVDRLIGSPDFIEYWTNKWADLLQVNRKFLDVEGATAFRAWIRSQVEKDVPYDQFVRSILTATGSNREHPEASYYKVLREPTALMENTTQLFLGVRFNCNKCHDHPFERWTQDQYYETAASFARVGLKGDPESKGRTIGGTAVEGANPLYEDVYDKPDGEVLHDRTKKAVAPKFPYASTHPDPQPTTTRRQDLAAWLTSADNTYFARSYVNRLWGYLLGVGIIEPIDDIRAGNPATNPELLDYLTQEFVKSGFDARQMLRLIAKSRTYQLSLSPNKWNEDDKINFSHEMARRLPAEVLVDAVYRATGSISKFPGLPPGTRAAALPDSGVELPGGFLATFGRPVRESACECERSGGLQLGPVMALLSGPTLGDALADPANELTKLVASQPDDTRLVNELFIRILNRPATAAEVASCLGDLGAIDDDNRKLAEETVAREAEVAQGLPAREQQRLADLATARADLASYETALAPKLAEQQKEQAAKVATLEADLKAYEGTLAARIAEWEKAQSPVSKWRVLTPKTVTGEKDKGATFQVLPDGSVLAGGGDSGETTLVVDTDLAGITGLRLELLTDPALPAKGPGRAVNGNFVINEMKVVATSLADPNQTGPLSLVKPVADYNQVGLDIGQVIDGKTDATNGWAIHPAMSVVHWATFELPTPAGAAGGSTLTFTFHHRFPGLHIPGRFRLSATTLPAPVGLDLPEDLRSIIATAPAVRTPAQVETLTTYHRTIDGGATARNANLAQARMPLPIDPGLQQRQDQVKRAEQPLAPDAKLARLKGDGAMSSQQATARRLTAAQDIAWALFNSPEFLFNH